MHAGSSEDSSEKSNKQGKLSPEDRLAIIRRVEAGEMQSAMAHEFGVSRQYVSLLMIKYREEGEDAVVGAKRGRKPSRLLTPDEQEAIHRAILENPTPKKAGLSIPGKRKNIWDMDSVKRLIARELRFTPTQRTVLDLLEKWGIAVGKPGKSAGLQFSKSYYEYVNSPIGKEVSRRNLEMRDRQLARRAEEERAMTKTQTESVGGAEGQPKEATAEEAEIELSDEELEKIRRRMLAGQSMSGGPGQRSGKHRKARTQQKRKPKNKKKRRKK